MAARRKYQWEEWFGRKTTEIRRGEHYHCSQSTMAGTIRCNASRRGVRVSLLDNGDSITIEVTSEISRTDQVTVAG